MTVLISKRELRQMVTGMGPEDVKMHLTEALETKQLKPADFSIRDLFEATVEDGPELVEEFNPRNGGMVRLTEAGVDTSLFAHISGQMIYTAILEKYQAPGFIGDKLCRTIPTKFSGETIPGVQQIGDTASNIAEGNPYPRAGVAETWLETPQTIKSGLIVDITKEAIFFDRTGLVLERCGDVGKWLAVNKEKRIIDMVIGATNNWKPKGVAHDTYSNSTGLHNFDNLANTNALADYTDINTVQDLFNAITDPGTGEPVLLEANQLLCTQALARTARVILRSIHVELSPNANSGTAMISPWVTPNDLLGQEFEILTSPLVLSRMDTGSVTNTNWYFGNFRKAFAYMENWPITVVQQNETSDASFERDVVVAFKASERGTVAVMEPRYAVLSAAS